MILLHAILLYPLGALSLLPFFTGRRSIPDYLVMAIWPAAWLLVFVLLLAQRPKP